MQRRWLRHHRVVLARLAESGGPKKILFVCYGNICRSPLAAALAQQTLAHIEIESAGFHETTNRSCPEKMLRIAGSLGLDLSQHRSARVTCEQLLRADLVIAMDGENLDRIRTECPDALPRTTLLGLFAEPVIVNIADLYLADESTTSKVCGQIRSSVEGLSRSLGSPQPASYPGNVSTAAQSTR
jgi:protein-tyrosine phosphatase